MIGAGRGIDHEVGAALRYAPNQPQEPELKGDSSMARVMTPELSNVSMQDMADAGLNPFAVQLLVESYAGKTATPPPLTFVWRGVVVSLKRYEEPAHDGVPSSVVLAVD